MSVIESLVCDKGFGAAREMPRFWQSIRRQTMKKSKVALAITVVTLGVSAANVRAQDPVSVCPNNFKVLAEDDTTRVLHFTQKKGETCGMHSHPYIVAYVIKSGQLTYVMPDGTK